MVKHIHTNIHGIMIPTPKDVFSNPRVKAFIQGQWMEKWLDYMGYKENDIFALINHAMNSIERSTSLGSTNLEAKLISHFRSPKLQVVKNMNTIMVNGRRGEKSRTDVIMDYLSKRLHSKLRILDIGTGNGLVAYRLANAGHEVCSIDVGDTSDTYERLGRLADGPKQLVLSRDLQYHLMEPGAGLEEVIPNFHENRYDMALVLTVFHHAQNSYYNPAYSKWTKGWHGLLDEAIRAVKPGGMIAVLESVYGGLSLGDLKQSIGNEKYAQNQALYESYFRLSDAEQLKLGVFADWWLNMLAFNNDAFCPYNFNSMQGWRELFFTKYGMDNSLELITGFDNPETPEFHVFWYLHKPKLYDNSKLNSQR